MIEEDVRKIIDDFYRLLHVRRAFNIREEEMFRRELFICLPQEWTTQIRMEERTRIKEMIRELPENKLKKPKLVLNLVLKEISKMR